MHSIEIDCIMINHHSKNTQPIISNIFSHGSCVMDLLDISEDWCHCHPQYHQYDYIACDSCVTWSKNIYESAGQGVNKSTQSIMHEGMANVCNNLMINRFEEL